MNQMKLNVKAKLKEQKSKIKGEKRREKKQKFKKKATEKKKAQTKMKLIHRLYALITLITLTCIIAAGFIYYYSQEVSRESDALEETASSQQQYGELINDLNMLGIRYYQLINSGYSQDGITEVEMYLENANNRYDQLIEQMGDSDELSHYFQFLRDAIDSYQLIYEQNFTTIFVGDEVEQIRNRIIPALSRNENSLQSVNNRIQDFLEEERENASVSLQNALTSSELIIMIALIILVFVPLIVLLLFSRSLFTGVQLVMKRIRAYHQGEFDYTNDTNRSDEFAEIDTRLEEMGNRLITIINKNKEISDDVLTVVKTTGQKSSEQLAGMDQIEKMMNEFSEEMQRQTEFTGTISATTEEVSASSEEIASTIACINNEIVTLEDVSNQGLDIMNDLEETMNQLDKQATETAERISVMDKHLTHISSFLNGIDDIADQTNLLAINASIEAARAGDDGNSFGVVAQEIRKLSQGTNDFSKQTKDVLDKLSKEVATIVKMFTEFQQRSEWTREKTVESASLFKKISTDNSKVAREHQDINESISQINRAIEEVVGSVSELVNGANILEEKSTNVQGIVNEQTERQKTLVEDVKSLENTADLLRN